MYTWFNKQRPGLGFDRYPHMQTKSAEADPFSIPQHSPGAKLDANKQLPYTVLGAFSPALQEVVKVGTYGAAKYTKHGWISVPNGKERYYEAMLRHLLEDLKTSDSKDVDTNISHLAHAAWNILAIITLRITNPKD